MRALTSALMEDHRSDLAVIPGLPPDPVHLPPGCPFHPRCPVRGDARCADQVPPLRTVGETTGTAPHRVATFYDPDAPADEAPIEDGST